MPFFYKVRFLYFFLFSIGVVLFFLPGETLSYEGIQQYYARYDIKSSKNKITTDNLLMIPAKNDFRTENFSLFNISGAISAASGGIESNIDEQIKQDGLKRLLTQHGLQSVKAKDLETVISHEGAVLTPLNIITKTYIEQERTYSYTIQVQFAPISFPDQWEKKNSRNKFKNLFYEFFELFK